MRQRSVVLAVAGMVCVSCVSLSATSRPHHAHSSTATPTFLNAERVTRVDIGVLVLAHGGSQEWDDTVRQAVRDAQLPVPTMAAFGMGMHPQELVQLQQAVDLLEQQGVQRLVVVPLLVSSHSEVFRQYEYLFGIRQQAEWPEAGPPIRRHASIIMGTPLDDHPVVADVLADRAVSLSETPAHETVVLVAHGPNGDRDNARWLEAMEHVAKLLKERSGFLRVVTVTMRDDATGSVKRDVLPIGQR